MVAEWKEFLWDVPEERVALWGHCQTLFIRYSFSSLQVYLSVLATVNEGIIILAILLASVFKGSIVISFAGWVIFP